MTAELQALTRRLTHAGYAEYLTSFDPYRFRPEQFLRYKALASPQLRVLIDFFLLNRSVHTDQLTGLLSTSWQVLVHLGLAETLPQNQVQLPTYVLHQHYGHWIFIDRPTADPNVYFGDDSQGLFHRITARPGDRVLDLCSGSGIQAFQSATYAAQVDAVEINPVARRVLRINSLMNGLGDRVRTFGGSLFEQVESGQRYDLVTANPPLVPFPNSVKYPFVGHGGIDGFAVTRKIISGLNIHLTELGRAQIIALTFSDGNALMIHDELDKLAQNLNLDFVITVINHVPMDASSAFFDGLAASAVQVETHTFDEIKQILRTELDERGLKYLTPYYLFVRRGSGKVYYQNMARYNREGLWFVLT
nr:MULTISPECIES: methyltransferase [unclassified Deinococcus]